MQDNDPYTKHIFDDFVERQAGKRENGKSIFDPFIPDNFGIIRDKFPCQEK